MSKKVIVIGAGLGGLATSALLAKEGYQVKVLEKNSLPGGRAQIYQAEGFTYDMGPSWYLMPDAFEIFFSQFGKKPSDYYQLIKLDPSYQVLFEDGDKFIVRPDIEYMAAKFEEYEPGAGATFRKHMQLMERKYKLGVPKFLLKEFKSPFEFLTKEVFQNLFNLQIEQSYHQTIAKKFKHPKLQQILEFMVVFLGGSPYRVPGLYNLINWADFGLGVYYPQGGFFAVVKGMEKLAIEQGVQFKYNEEVREILVENGVAQKVVTASAEYEADIVIGYADYVHIESQLLKAEYRSYPNKYWQKADLAPSGLCFYLGLNQKVEGLLHHTLVFNNQWREHFKSVEEGLNPERPQYYLSAPSKTDPNVAPAGMENLFVLVPTASGLLDTAEYREKIFNYVIDDINSKLKLDIKPLIIHKRAYWINDFAKDYNAYKGNAFGLGHTLKHSLFFRPKNRSKKVKNLFYTGQFTNPGTGTPLVVLSGIVVRDLIKKYGF
ncbi:MAG: phytoene desaturase family protein [Candidatus Dojkabacteria bacterium]